MSFAGTEIVVLDVGHGNTALLRSGEWVALVDVAPSAVVVDELESLSISRVDDVFISHVERDHAGRVEKLLNAPWLAVGHVWVNPDSETDSVKWERLRTALWHLHQREGVSVTTALNRGTNDFHHGEMRVEVLHPDVGWALGSVGGERTVNAMSVVIKVWMQGVAAALLAADVTKSGLDRLLSAGLDLAAKVLVFPHHGGRAATADGESFARMLSASVSPELVIFSLGRLKESNPRPGNGRRGAGSGAGGSYRVFTTFKALRSR